MCARMSGPVEIDREHCRPDEECAAARARDLVGLEVLVPDLVKVGDALGGHNALLDQMHGFLADKTPQPP